MDRHIQPEGNVFVFIGINPSTADASINDATVRKWISFSKRWGASRFIVGNIFAYRATDVNELKYAEDPIGIDNPKHIASICQEADIIIPCWGNSSKVPKNLQYCISWMENTIREQGKPIKCFGVTGSGDPKHPLMLGYNTQLIDWN